MSDLHFPLALLAYGSGENWSATRGAAIMTWACDSRGRAKMEEDGVDEDVIANQCDSETWAQVDDVEDSSRDDAVAWAAGTLNGWRITKFDFHRESLNAAQSFVKNLETLAGKSPFVRVPSDFATEALGWSKESQGMTYREFSVLCAVYSCTGERDCGIVRREQVRDRQAGAWNEKAKRRLEFPNGEFQKLGNYYDTPAPMPKQALNLLTLDQIRYTMDELEGRGLFHRVVGPNKRDTYFSRHLQGKEFVARVASMVKRRHARREQRAVNQAMLDAALAKPE